MADDSVAAFDPPSNDVFSVARIIELNLKYYATHFSPLEKNYLQALNVIIGLGFTAVLIDGDLIDLYRARLDAFFKYRDFKRHHDSLSKMSLVVAEMIDLVRMSLVNSNYLSCKQDFIISIETVLNSVISRMMGKQKEVDDFLKILLQLID